MDSKNVSALRAAHDAFSARDYDRAAQLVAPSIHFIDHGRGITVTSQTDFQGWLEGLLAMSSDMTLVDQEYIAAGDWVTARFRAVGV